MGLKGPLHHPMEPSVSVHRSFLEEALGRLEKEVNYIGSFNVVRRARTPNQYSLGPFLETTKSARLTNQAVGIVWSLKVVGTF